MRFALWLFILWQVFWMNIFIPGHTRGAYGEVGGGCCAPAVKSASCCKAGKPEGQQPPTEEQKQRCVVCYIAKGYTVATAFVVELAPSGRAVERIHARQAQVRSVRFELPFYPIGPPAA